MKNCQAHFKSDAEHNFNELQTIGYMSKPLKLLKPLPEWFGNINQKSTEPGKGIKTVTPSLSINYKPTFTVYPLITVLCIQNINP